ncbi:MAG: acyl-CoA reductase [Lachnospiraceae bacterium]
MIENKMKFYVGNYEILERMPNVPVLPVFSEKIIDFFSSLSDKLLKNAENKKLRDVYSYAYWIRKASVVKAKSYQGDIENRVGRGVAFHVAPSNVPVNFAVTMTSSLLAGNVTAIRVSNKEFEQVKIICRAINELFNEGFECIRAYICIFQYDHDEEVTKWLSDMCDVRIIWGGDETVQSIRRIPLKPRSIEMAFPDRYSIALIDSDYYMLNVKECVKIAKDFYIDTYYSDQNACSSPRLLVWFGNRTEDAKKIFWGELKKLVDYEYDMKPIQSVDKYTSFCELAMQYKNVSLSSEDNFIMRVNLNELSEQIMELKNSGGYFFEYNARYLDEIIPVLGKRCQTISYYGLDKEIIKNLVISNGVRGVDRIVPIGQTMALEFVWDGYKMIETMSRVIY